MTQERTAMSRYIMICQELLQEQYPSLHERLRSSRTLLSTLELQAAALKRYHEDRMDRLTQARPDLDPTMIASQALELALQDLRGDLPCESPPSGSEMESLSLDEAMASLRQATPRA
jgi:hypothetical protein